MKFTALISLFGLSLILSGCSNEKEPAFIEGENQASDVVYAFMKALEDRDYKRARYYIYEDADYVLKDCDRMRELFYGHRKLTSMTTQNIGHHQYGMDWHIQVDLKINYGDMMKLIRFSLVEGSPPKLRGLRSLNP